MRSICKWKRFVAVERILTIRHSLGLGVLRLILVCRDVSKGEIARARLTSIMEQVASNKIEVWRVDLDYYAFVLEFCNRINI